MGPRRIAARRGLFQGVCLLVVSAALLGPGAPASAQPARSWAESAKDKDLARKLADEGQRLFDSGDYRGAIRKLEEAHAKFAAPTIELAQAEAHEKLGELREAQAIYQRLARSKIADSAPPEFREAQKDAEKAAVRLEKAIPKVILVLVGKAPAVLSIALDGATLDGEIWGAPTPLDPGEHTLVIEMTGRASETRSFTLAEGETRRVEIRTGADGPAPAAESKGAGRSFVGPGVAFGIGAAGLLVGGIAGGVALAKMGQFKEACGAELRCPGALEGELSGARIAGHFSTIGFAVAGVGAVMGTVLLVVPLGGDKGAPAGGDKGAPAGDKAARAGGDKGAPAGGEAARAAGRRGFSGVSLGVGPFGLSVTGRF